MKQVIWVAGHMEIRIKITSSLRAICEMHILVTFVMFYRGWVANLTARAYKTQFVREKTKCLEYVVGNGKIAPNPDKLNAFENFTVCTLYKSVLEILRITGY